MEQVKELLVTILGSIVSHPEDIQISESIETDDKGEAVVLSVVANREDVGTCIGVKGATAQSIRKIIGISATKNLRKRVFVRIDAPENSGKSRFDV